MIEIKKKQTKIDWKLLSRITSGIIISFANLTIE